MSIGEKVLAIAEAELGVAESPSGSNKVKYNTWFYGKEVSGAGYPWCMVFVNWCYAQAGYPLPTPHEVSASCSGVLNWYKKTQPQCIVTAPEKGDIIIYNFGHTGIYYGGAVNLVYAIEGNTSRGNDTNGGTVMRRNRERSQVAGFIRPSLGTFAPKGAKYYRKDGVDIVETSADRISIVMVDALKRSAGASNYANAGFFANYAEAGQSFTLPVAHLAADYEATNTFTDFYTRQRGVRAGKKVVMDSSMYKPGNDAFYRKAISTLILSGNIARIDEITQMPSSATYAISGVPIMRNGEDVIFKTFVKGQGWEAGNVRAAWHTFIGLKANPTATVYIMGWKSTRSNMISTAEAFKKFKAMGFRDVIKLDGGGSYHFNVNGRVMSTTDENRRINTIIAWGETDEEGNPYPVPTKTLRKGSKGDGVKWLQWQLDHLGYDCGTIDGDFGSKTVAAVKAFQKAKGLAKDGVVGPATRAALTA